MLLPDIPRGPTWSAEHMTRCLVRQLLRWRESRNRGAIEVMQRSRIYPSIKAQAESQWAKGNRGQAGDWR